MHRSEKSLETEFTLPNWLRRMGKWWALLFMSILLITLSAIITYWVMIFLMGKATQIGMMLGIIIPLLTGPAPLFLFLNSIFELDKLQLKYQHLSHTDGLTQAFNRRYLMDQIESEIQRSQRYQKNFSLIMMDCDNFKQVNDQYGHPVGDQFLIHLVNTCQSRIRSTDTIARMGGDEFMILLPETRGSKAKILAEDLREIIPDSFELFKEHPNFVTMSFGVTSWHPNIENSSELIKKLDNALYEAKRHGKNKVVHYTQELVLPKNLR